MENASVRLALIGLNTAVPAVPNVELDTLNPHVLKRKELLTEKL